MTRDITQTALMFAEFAHGRARQKRKFTGEPYVVHPIAVARLVSTVTEDSATIAAALLHDVVEDTFVTPTMVFDLFGEEIAQLVMEVTDVSTPEDGNRATRKALDLAHLAKASSRGQTIKLADLIDNSRTIIEHDRHFARIYLGEKAQLLRVLTAGHPTLHRQATEMLEAGFSALGVAPAA